MGSLFICLSGGSSVILLKIPACKEADMNLIKETSKKLLKLAVDPCVFTHPEEEAICLCVQEKSLPFIPLNRSPS